MPVFNGVEVQRRIFRARGSAEPELLEDWRSIDLAANSQPLRAVKLAYNEDPADLKRVMLHEDNLLDMPLPHEIAGKYPDYKSLKTITEAIAKLKGRDPKNQIAPRPNSRFGGEGNPFKRDEGPNASLFNGGIPGMNLPPARGAQKKDAKDTGALDPNRFDPPDYIYVRAYDTDIKDGMVYKYRIRVKVKNPNYQKKDLVAKASDAENEELPPLEEHWFEIPQWVKIPQAGYYYVVDPTPSTSKVANPLPQPKEGQAVVQFQNWIGKLEDGYREEPIGDWVVSELLATRGQFVGGKAFSPVPTWSPTENKFVLQALPGQVVPKGKEPRRGILFEPIHHGYLLAVDVAGGATRVRTPVNLGEKANRQPSLADESATQILFLLPDGTLEVRSTAKDKVDPERKEREDAFKKWVDDTEKGNPPDGPAPKKKDNDF